MTQVGADALGSGRSPAANRRDEQTYAIIGAAMEVHGQLGRGFLEPVYQEALAIELMARNIEFKRELTLPVQYKGSALACSYKADFVCYDDIIVELKALVTLTSVEQSLVINYLKATGKQRGLLLNFGTERLQYRRVVLTRPLSAPSASSADRKRNLS